MCMAQLRFSTVTDIKEAQALWNAFTPDRFINDVWAVRYCFYKYFNYPLSFYVGYDGDTAVGILPLQYNTDENYLEFFGGYYFSDNNAFVKSGYESSIPDFYHLVDRPCKLTEIVGTDPFTASLPVQYNRYVLDLGPYPSYQEYIQNHFQVKDRTNFKRKMRAMEREPVEIVKNNFADLDLLIKLNIKHFGDKSFFNKPFRREYIFHDLLKEPLNFQLLTFVVNGKKEAVSLAVLYHDTYTFIHYGRTMEPYQHLGTYITMKNIENAIALGARWFDAGAEDFGWKESWGLGKIPLHIYSTLAR